MKSKIHDSKTFKEIKNQVLEIANKNHACSSEYRRAANAKNKKELLQIIKENACWLHNNAREMVSPEFLDGFGEKSCNKAGIFYKGEIKKIIDRKDLILLGNCKVEMLGNSQVKEMLGNSQVKEMLGNSQVGKMWGNSQVGKMWGNSQVGEMLGNSQVKEMWDNSQVGKMLDNSQVGKMWDNSQVGEMWDNSQVKEMWGNSQVGKMRGNSIARSYNGNLPKETGLRCCYVDLKNKEVHIGEELKVVEKVTA